MIQTSTVATTLAEMTTQIDWKAVADCTGYRSLAKAYEDDLRRKYRTKSELRRLFKWVIGRATHKAHKVNPDNLTRRIIWYLNEWEMKRDYWWINYYTDRRIPKVHSNSIKGMGAKGRRKHRMRYAPKRRGKLFVQDQHMFAVQARKALGKKPRWSVKFKQQVAYHRLHQSL